MNSLLEELALNTLGFLRRVLLAVEGHDDFAVVDDGLQVHGPAPEAVHVAERFFGVLEVELDPLEGVLEV